MLNGLDNIRLAESMSTSDFESGKGKVSFKGITIPQIQLAKIFIVKELVAIATKIENDFFHSECSIC